MLLKLSVLGSLLFSVSLFASDREFKLFDFQFGNDSAKTRQLLNLVSDKEKENNVSKELSEILDNAKKAAILYETPNQTLAAIVFMSVKTAKDSSSYIDAYTKVYFRIQDRALPESCKNPTELTSDERVIKCYGYVPDKSPDPEKDAFALVTYFTGGGSTLLNALTNQVKFLTEFIVNDSRVIKAVAIENGFEKDINALSIHFIVMGGLPYSRIALMAHGFRPNLLSPKLWELGETIHPLSKKYLDAAYFMEKNDLAFVDKNFTAEGSKLVKLSTYTKPDGGTMMGYNLEKELDAAMAEQGFEYKDGQWQKK